MKRKLNKLDLNLYSETIDNGLNVYVIPKKTRNIYATFTTKYGSMINEFIPKPYSLFIYPILFI